MYLDEYKNFYGRKKTQARPILDESEDRELSSESDTEVDAAASVQSPELSNSSSDENDVPLATRLSSRSSKPTWKKKPLSAVKEKSVPFSGEAFMVEDDIKAPIKYFRSLFDESLFDIIVEQSNLYSTQNNPNRPLGLTSAELEQSVGILFVMSIVSMPRHACTGVLARDTRRLPV